MRWSRGGARRVAAGADGGLRAPRSGQLAMVATDSYRLSVKESEIAGDVPELEAIVPARALDELRRIAGGGGQVELAVLDNHVAFGADGVWLTTRKIDGQFPDHTKLIPETGEFAVDLSLTRSEILDVVRRMAVMAHRASPLRLRLGRGRADDFRPDPRHRRSLANRCPSRTPASRSRSGSTPHYLQRRNRVGGGRRARAAAHQPAAPGPRPRARRGLPLPHHAHPARRTDRLEPHTPRLPLVRSLDLALGPGLVLAAGPNGAGKTNLLESLHVATQGFSPRTRSRRESRPLRC